MEPESWEVGAVSDGVEGGRARPQADFVGRDYGLLLLSICKRVGSLSTRFCNLSSLAFT